MADPLTESAPTPPGLTPGNRRMLLWSMLAAGASTPIMFTVLPAYGERTGLSATQTGALIALSGLAFALAAPWWGRKTDSWGRSRVLIVGLVGYGLAYLLFAAFAQFGLQGWLTGTALFVVLLLTRPLGGGLAAAIPPASMASIADRTSLAQRASGMALIGSATGLGLIIGPAVGALGGVVGLLVPIWVVGVLAILLALIVPKALPEVPRSAGPAMTAPRMRLGDRRVLAWLLGTFAVFTVVAAVGSTTGYIIRDRFDADPLAIAQQSGLYLVVAGLGLAGVQIVLSRRRVAPAASIAIGSLLAAVGLAFYGWAPHLAVLVLGGLLQGVGVGLILPGLYGGASMSVSPAEQGAIGGMVTFSQAMAFAVGPVVGGVLFDLHPDLFPVAGVVVFLAVAVLAWRARHPAAAAPEPSSADAPPAAQAR